MPVPGSCGIFCGEPREALGGAERRWTTSSARLSRSSGAAQHEEVVAELIDDVVDDAIVRGRGRAEDRNAGRQQIEDAGDAPVVGPEVVTPVADAVRLVDHEQTRRGGDAGQHVGRGSRRLANRSGETSRRSTSSRRRSRRRSRPTRRCCRS